MRATAIGIIIGLALSGSVVAGTPAAAATPPTVSVGDTTVSEGNARTTPARVAVRLSDPVATTTVVRFATGGGTAAAGADYRNRSASVRIRPGKTTGFITVAVFGDTVPEATESLGLTLLSAGSVPIADRDGTVTIRDDEGVTGISIGDATIWEGDTQKGLVKLTVVLGSAGGTDTAVTYTLTNGTATAPSDFRARSGRAKIRAGRTTATITPTAFSDVVREGDEVFQVVLTGTSGATISDAVGTVSIRDDEPAPPPPPPPPPPATPGAPADLTATPGPFARYLTADWSPATSTLPITGYDLEVTRGTTTNIVMNVTAPYAFGCGLAEVTATCTMRVRARNGSGDGTWSDPVTASTWAPPAAPPNLTVLGSGGAVEWDVPASDRPIDFYEVQKQAIGATSWVHVDSTTLTHAATTCGSCSVRVSAHSDIGFGPWSTVTIALPGPPTGLSATRDALNHELVHLTWSPPVDPGSHPITFYEIVVNGFLLPTTATPNADVFLRSTVSWEVQVWAYSALGRSVFPAMVIVPPG